MSEENCSHDWKPILGWTGRYRCTICESVGYRTTISQLRVGFQDTIRPYVCQKRIIGKPCGKPAVVVRKSRSNDRCKEHSDGWI